MLRCNILVYMSFFLSVSAFLRMSNWKKLIINVQRLSNSFAVMSDCWVNGTSKKVDLLLKPWTFELSLKKGIKIMPKTIGNMTTDCQPCMRLLEVMNWPNLRKCAISSHNLITNPSGERTERLSNQKVCALRFADFLRWCSSPRSASRTISFCFLLVVVSLCSIFVKSDLKTSGLLRFGTESVEILFKLYTLNSFLFRNLMHGEKRWFQTLQASRVDARSATTVGEEVGRTAKPVGENKRKSSSSDKSVWQFQSNRKQGQSNTRSTRFTLFSVWVSEGM